MPGALPLLSVSTHAGPVYHNHCNVMNRAVSALPSIPGLPAMAMAVLMPGALPVHGEKLGCTVGEAMHVHKESMHGGKISFGDKRSKLNVKQ